MSPTDQEIIDDIKRGKKYLYAKIIERYKDKGFGLAMRILRNREDAEEAIQDAFVRAYNGLGKFEGKSKFGTWFYRIVYNVCLSKLALRKDKATTIEFGVDEDAEISSDEWQNISSSQQYESKETLELIRKSVDRMPEKYGIILSLFYFKELSYEEIGAILDLPAGTVKSHLFRARTMLRKQLADQYHLDGATA
jgi:RNA polymerase sigma-70 factor (ECF subfamily)